MNISTTIRPRLAVGRIPTPPTPAGVTKSSAERDGFTDGVVQGSQIAGTIGGTIAGLKLGWKAGIEIAYLSGQYEAGLILLGCAAAGGIAGYFAGQYAPPLAGQAFALGAETLGIAPQVGRAVGSAAAATVLGAGAFSSLGALAGAGTSLGVGAYRHFHGGQ